MAEEQFFLIRKCNGETTAQQEFSSKELKKAVVEALIYARSKDSRPNSQAKYNNALKKINQVIWNNAYFPSREAEKRRHKK